MTGKPNITIVGSINMDLVVRCENIPLPGQTILAESSAEFCGGKGANQAVGASRAGGNVTMIGRVGSDAFADRLVGNLNDSGVNTDWVDRCDGCASGLAVIAVEQSGENSIMVIPGANEKLSPSDIANAESVIAESDVLLLQLEIPVDSVLAAIQCAHQNGTPVILDPAPTPVSVPPQLLDVDLIVPNETEAAAFVGHPVESDDDVESAARKLNEMGAKFVAITMGHRGTFVLHNGQTQWVDSFDVHAIDTTAAGDAFAGALAVRWSMDENDFLDSVKFANAAGALAASRRGAQASMPSEHEIESLWRTQNAN